MKRNVEDWIHGRGPKLDLIDQVLQRVLADEGLDCGRMISQSKSRYDEAHPDHTVFFNACIFVRLRSSGCYLPGPLAKWRYQQVWWGDLDLNLDQSALQRVADLRREALYVTRERYSWDGLTDKDIKINRYEGIMIFRPEV